MRSCENPTACADFGTMARMSFPPPPGPPRPPHYGPQPGPPPPQYQGYGPRPPAFGPTPTARPNTTLVRITAGITAAAALLLALTLYGRAHELIENFGLDVYRGAVSGAILHVATLALVLASTVLLVFGAIQLFRAKRNGVLLTLVGGILAVVSDATHILGWALTLATQSERPQATGEYLSRAVAEIPASSGLWDVVLILIAVAVVVLALLPAVRRSVRRRREDYGLG
jgi:hypothetical protein